jgi:hypothetical protein
MLPSERFEMSREEFYRFIRNIPPERLFKEYELTEELLNNICTKFHIPNPVSTGDTTTCSDASNDPLPLPEFEHPILKRIHVHKYLYPYIEDEKLPKEFQSLISAEDNPDNRIIVPDKSQTLHPLVEKTKNVFSKLLAQKGKFLTLPYGSKHGCLNLNVTRTSLDRALHIFDTLIKALEKRGYHVTVDPSDKTEVIILNEKISIKMEEIDGPRPGRLGFILWKDWVNDIDQQWRDRRQERLENMLNSFVVGLVNAAGRQWLMHRIDRTLAMEKEKQENRQKVDEAYRKAEQERIDALMKEINKWELCQKVRAYIEAVTNAALKKNGNIAAGSPLAEWIAWATKLADGNDPVLKRIDIS